MIFDLIGFRAALPFLSACERPARVAGVPYDLEQPGAEICSLVEACKKAKCPQVGLLNLVFGIFLIFHQPTSEVVCIIHERQHKSFKACASLLVIHGRRLPYNQTYRLSFEVSYLSPVFWRGRNNF